jgi:hypothetical protein
MFIVRGDVIDICVTEIQVLRTSSMNHLNVYPAFRSLKGIQEFRKPKGRDDGCFCDAILMTWELVLCFHKIYYEHSAASKLLCKIGLVPDRLLVGVGPSVSGVPRNFFGWFNKFS